MQQEPNKYVKELTQEKYKYGFTTDVHTDIIEKGLNEDVVRLISAKKGEPEWLLEFRLKAYRHWLTMEMPTWAHLNIPEIDYQAISYYADPTQKKEGPKSLDEVDPELLKTFNKLGIPLEEQMALSGMAVDAVMDSVSVKTTFKETLMEKGIPFWDYIDKCFYERTYTQAQLLGRTLLASMRVFDGKCIVATITRRMMEFYGAKTEDIEGIVDQLRITKGIEVAILLHETDEQCYKVSMRSNDYVDVGKVASYFNGGGHVKAAGCTMLGSIHDVINNLTEQLAFQMK